MSYSLGLEGGRLLVVEVLSASLEFVALLLLHGASASSHFSQLALVLTVGKHLLSAQVLLLHGPLALFLLLLLLHHFCLPHLQASLVHDFGCFLGVESLEVVGSDAVLRKHALFAGRVLSHEVVVVCTVHISGSLELLVLGLGQVSVALLLSELHVGILDGLFHGNTGGSVLVLGVFKQLSKVLLLFVVHSVSEFGLFLEHLFLADLLVNPVLLL